jgi:hypothetical protein
MRAIASIMRSSSSSHVSTFLLYTTLFIQPHKQKSNGVRPGDLGGQLMVPPRLRKVSQMLHHKPVVMRRGSVMLKVYSNPSSQRNIL